MQWCIVALVFAAKDRGCRVLHDPKASLYYIGVKEERMMMKRLCGLQAPPLALGIFFLCLNHLFENFISWPVVEKYKELTRFDCKKSNLQVKICLIVFPWPGKRPLSLVINTRAELRAARQGTLRPHPVQSSWCSCLALWLCTSVSSNNFSLIAKMAGA